MKTSRLAARIVALSTLLTALLGAGTSLAQSPNDDNGDHAFVRQALPHLLGRRPHNSIEVKVLADLIEMRGREAVLRSLMKRPEFFRHWTENMADIMHAERLDSAACMNAPLRLANENGHAVGDDGDLAEYIGTHSIGQFMAGAFNWYDATYSSLELGSLVPAYRAYLFMRAHEGNGSDSERRERAAHRFFTELLNRNVNCMVCHNANSEPQNEADWDKQHPLHPTVDGDAGVGASLNAVAPMFRNDLFVSGDDFPGYGPWGMSTACAEMDNPGLATASVEGLDVSFAGLSGDDVSIKELSDALMWGFDDLDATEMPIQDPPTDGASAFAYLLAAQAVNGVWEYVMGESLTLPHGFARNVHQRELHRFLVEDVFLTEQWSLQDLLVEILLLPEFNRRAPVNSGRPTAYEVAPVFNAMLPERSCDAEPTPTPGGPGSLSGTQRDPVSATRDDGWLATTSRTAVDGAAYAMAAAGADTGSDPQTLHVAIPGAMAGGLVSGCTNGQGEIQHRHRPRVLLGSVSSALGWKPPPLSPDTSYPSEDLMFELGQYLSHTKPGTEMVDFASYLSWENAVGRCSGSGKLPADASSDWIGYLLTARGQFDAANPENPIRLGELALAVKDRILQRPRFGAFEPDDGSIFGSGDKVLELPGGYSGPAEMALLQQFFGADLDSAAVGTPLLEAKLRDLCGVYVTSPEFMLTGIDTGVDYSAPRLTACLPDEPCSYTAICNEHRVGLPNAVALSCMGNQVTETGGLSIETVPWVVEPPEPCLDCLKSRPAEPRSVPLEVPERTATKTVTTSRTMAPTTMKTGSRTNTLR